jgi:rhomboid protease GluP
LPLSSDLRLPPLPPGVSAPPPRLPFPWATAIICLACIGIFLVYFLSPDRIETFTPSAVAIWQKHQFYRLLTDAFIHFHPFHMFLNVYWAWILGQWVERQMGLVYYLLFILAAAFVSSSFELATGQSGIGLSGVIYAIAGYMMLMRKQVPIFGKVMTDTLIKLFVAWLFICLPLTWFGIMSIGNAAHFSGFIFGIAIAGTFGANYKRPLLTSVAIAMFLVSFIPPVWCPWAITWLSAKALAAQDAKQYDQSLALYDKILTHDPNDTFALYNSGIILIQQGHPQQGQARIDKANALTPATQPKPKTKNYMEIYDP